MEYFSHVWWDAYRGAWNAACEDRSAFGRLGAIRIEIADAPLLSAELNWASDGSLESIAVGSTSSSPLPTFTAPRSVWQEFVAGGVSAARLVLRGKVRYQGPTTLLLTYGPHFDFLGLVGSRVV